MHLRPFLDLPQTVLADYADTHGLQWVEDPSNQATHYQRNYLRQTLWPLITARWPSADATLARVAHHSAEAAGLNATLANKDSEQVIDRDHCIHLASLLQLDAPRQRNVVRHWLKQASGRFPSQRLMQTLLTTVVNAKGDAQPAVQHDTLTVRRYRGRLYALPSLPTLPPTGRWFGRTHNNRWKFRHWGSHCLCLYCRLATMNRCIKGGLRLHYAGAAKPFHWQATAQIAKSPVAGKGRTAVAAQPVTASVCGWRIGLHLYNARYNIF